MKKCMNYEVDGARDLEADQRKLGVRSKEKVCHTQELCKEDAVNLGKWKKLIKDVV